MTNKPQASGSNAGVGIKTHHPPGGDAPGERREDMMRNKLRMTYYLPKQSKLFSEPQVFETQDGKEWGRAVNIAHEKGYEIVKVERI